MHWKILWWWEKKSMEQRVLGSLRDFIELVLFFRRVESTLSAWSQEWAKFATKNVAYHAENQWRSPCAVVGSLLGRNRQPCSYLGDSVLTFRGCGQRLDTKGPGYLLEIAVLDIWLHLVNMNCSYWKLGDLKLEISSSGIMKIQKGSLICCLQEMRCVSTIFYNM